MDAKSGPGDNVEMVFGQSGDGQIGFDPAAFIAL